MRDPSLIGGPVSAALEEEIRDVIRKHQVVVWLDGEDRYTPFVDRLIAARAAVALPYEVRGYRGSYLELMLGLEELTRPTAPPLLLLHLPGANEDSVRHTPMYELYAVGARFRKKLSTLVTEAAAGKASPEALAELLQADDLTLEQADAWLAAIERDEAGAEGQALAGVSAFSLLRGLRESMNPQAEGLAATLRGLTLAEVGQQTITGRLRVLLGMPDRWLDDTFPGVSPRRGEDLAAGAASWALCVEYVRDLRRAPHSPLLPALEDIPRPLVEACYELAAALREEEPSFYRSIADHTQGLLHEEIEQAQAEDLGKIDTFRFEEETVFHEALKALAEGRWRAATEWSELRLGLSKGSRGVKRPASFWVRDDVMRHRRRSWLFVLEGSRLGIAIDAAERLGASSFEEAAKRYQSIGAPVDRLHRRLEQMRRLHLAGLEEDGERLRPHLDSLRWRWRTWADHWAKAFNVLCKERGFLPPRELQQRTLFDQAVLPAVGEAPTAYILVDALRYELGEELARSIEEEAGAVVQLDARFAELPTVTAVGMNALPPVERNGRLHLVMDRKNGDEIRGIAAGEFQVRNPESRRAAMRAKASDNCPVYKLEALLGEDPETLRRSVAQSRLLFVHSLEIDEAGEVGVGLHVFDDVVSQLHHAWRKLWNAGVRRFVITADHGFLLHDTLTGRPQRHGTRGATDRRHAISYVAADNEDVVRVPMSALEYEVGASAHLMFPETTAVFDTGRPIHGFVHGGNSLQERLIPVITIRHRGKPGGRTLELELTANAKPPVAGMQCVAAKVELAAQQELAFGGPQHVELALRVPDAPTVRVTLLDVRGDASLDAGRLIAGVGAEFELFFRLEGPHDAKELVEFYHPGEAAQVRPGGPMERFAVVGSADAPKQPQVLREAPASWLDAFDDDGVRKVFGVLQEQGSVGEEDLTTLLGSARAARRFAKDFDDNLRRAPFDVRIESVGGLKRYVRTGGKG